jgi:hypothetical protein
LQFGDRYLEIDAALVDAPQFEQVITLEISALFKTHNLGKHPEAK